LATTSFLYHCHGIRGYQHLRTEYSGGATIHHVERSAAVSHASNTGGDVAYTAATVACPHVDECTLAEACPGRVYAPYAECFGLSELSLAHRSDLYP
jgi:hypothetical protein